MKLEVGMYARTKEGKIFKINETNVVGKNYYLDIRETREIIKASYNIVNLIKSKDIILGRDGKIYQCQKIYTDYVFTYSKNKQGQTITLVDYQIDKVLTKEQFEQMAYKVGE